MIKEAMLWDQLENSKVQCTLCAHTCKISEGNTGICGVRRNDGGKLNTLIYNSASSMNPDPIEKKPLFHFHPGSNAYSLGTIGCNFSCEHCQNFSISFAKVDGTHLREVSPKEVIESARRLNCQGIAWTYNEPTIWFEYTYNTSKLAKEAGLYSVYVTNGYMSESALDKISPYLDGANVDVKAFREEFYKRVCKAKLEPVLRTCERMKKMSIHLELTYLLIPTKNDDPEEIKEFCDWAASIGKDTPVHFSRFHPMHGMSHLRSTPIETLEMAYKSAKEAGIEYVYLGNVYAHRYENSYCPDCDELLIERRGYHIIPRIRSYDKCPKCGRELNIIN
ncbi:MAG: AmmeMemoRadiSam system radical SAM enzyme [Halobacteriota archaeon]|nr:AmmeMemoRadiSam system radical SAM enzyme [Halobacteriota archaeon]